MRFATSKTLDIDTFLSAVGSERKITLYRKKQIIFSQGDRSDSMFYVAHGSVKLTIVSREGKEAVISIAGPGKFFGESCISSDDAVRFQSAVALTDTGLVRIGNTAVLRMIRAGGDVSVNFIASILRQNARIQEDLGGRLVDSAEESLAHVISSVVQFNVKQGFLPKISQQTIAEMMGITRQRVNVLMKRFRVTPPAPGSRGNVLPPANVPDRDSGTLPSLFRETRGKQKP